MKPGAALRILGLDPGTAILGFGVLDVERGSRTHVTHGVIRTPAGTPMGERLATIAADLAELLRRYEPDEVAVEQLFFAKNTTTAIAVAQARGVTLAAVAGAGIPLFEYTPPQVKQAVGGAGAARKPEVQEMVKRLLKLAARPTPDDAADALAVALTHAVRRGHPGSRRGT